MPRCIFICSGFFIFKFITKGVRSCVPLNKTHGPHFMKNNRKHILKLTQMAMLAAIAVVIGLFKFPILPVAPFLEFDFADTPIIISSLLFGTLPGLAVLFIVSVIQAFLLGGNGVIGLIMHFAASGIMLVVVNLIAGKAVDGKRSIKRLIVALICGTLAQTAAMIPLNYIFIPMLFGAPREMVTELLLPGIIPFNLIKAGVNCILAAILQRILGGFFAKSTAE